MMSLRALNAALLRMDIARLLARGDREGFGEGWPECPARPAGLHVVPTTALSFRHRTVYVDIAGSWPRDVERN